MNAPAQFNRNQRAMLPGIGDEEAIAEALGLGDLAGLTVTNEADPLCYEVSDILYLGIQ